MNHDAQTPPGVHLEITVPVIQFPQLTNATASEDTTASEAAPVTDPPIIEQVRLRTHDLTDHQEGNQSQQGEIATYTTRHGLFRQFRFRQVPTQGQRFVVQVWRCWQKAQTGKIVNDECTLSVSFAQETNQTQEVIQPGMNQIVLLLDAEGVPTNYRVDGSQNG